MMRTAAVLAADGDLKQAIVVLPDLMERLHRSDPFQGIEDAALASPKNVCINWRSRWPVRTGYHPAEAHPDDLDRLQSISGRP